VSEVARGSLQGRLLVATPPLTDENFDRTVVLLLEHSPEGALGLVLNRPTDEEVAEHLHPWAVHTSMPAVLFYGGPVQPDGVIALARAAGTDAPPGPSIGAIPVPADDSVRRSAFSPLLGRLGTVDLTVLPGEVDLDFEGLRVFTGYSGWTGGQLEGELELGAWIVVDAEPSDPFHPDPEKLWRTVLKRQGGRLSWLANFPDDPEAN
jgi:putative transcriptional regulator